MAADTIHNRLIDQICQMDGIAASGFAEAHRMLCKELDVKVAEPKFRPDAFRFNRETTEIEIYEVEVQNSLTRRKITQLGEYWEDWDGEGEVNWLPVLIVVNRYGNHTKLDLVDAIELSGPFANL